MAQRPKMINTVYNVFVDKMEWNETNYAYSSIFA